MDLFSFTKGAAQDPIPYPESYDGNPIGRTLGLTEGAFINNLKSVEWIERWQEAGEFRIVAPLSADLRETLKIGTCISHMKTREVMIVEDHEINQSLTEEAEIIITGRSLETIWATRVVGAYSHANQISIAGYTLPNVGARGQLYYIVAYHTMPNWVYYKHDYLPGFSIEPIPDADPALGQEFIAAQPLYDAVLTLLKSRKLGVKTKRPDATTPINFYAYNRQETRAVFYWGEDKRQTVIFNWESGDIESIRYFWSNREHRNTVFATTIMENVRTWFYPWQFDQRMLHVDGSSSVRYIGDQNAGQGQYILYKLGATELAKVDQPIQLAEATIAANARYVYRQDYDIGDRVTVLGDYGMKQQMRVVEHAEFWDKNGTVSRPTLEILVEEA